MIKKIVLTLLLGASCAMVTAQNTKCDYFNLKQPQSSPRDFNPQLLELNNSFKFNVAFHNCDEVYFTTIASSESIYYSKRTGDTWSAPKIASFSDPRHNDADPYLSPDGQRIYFISKRPTSNSDSNLDYNIWYADRSKDSWEAPKPLPKPINSDDYDEYFFSISKNGNAYFSSDRPGGQGSFDIYTVKILENNQFSEPKNAGRPLNTERYEFDPYISPNEQFIIFSINDNGNSSLHISQKDKEGNWTKAQNLGSTINQTNQDFAPSLSRDGRFLFYSNNGKLRWVSTEVLKTGN